MTRANRQLVLSSRPDGAVTLSNFQLRESTIAALPPGHVLVRTQYLSIDPWLRPAMDHDALLPLDTVVPGDVVGCVVESRHVLFRTGDFVQGLLGWQEYVAAPWYLLRKVDPSIAPITTALGLLGSSGLTAYIGLFHVGRIAPRETVVISAAAGAVGSAAAQLARLAGCQVIGIAGSDDKVRYLTNDLGLHAALNYKAEPAWRSRLAVYSPFGVDMYFDNVGGRVSDAVLPVMNTKARVVVCGQIASYDRRMRTSRLPWLGVGTREADPRRGIPRQRLCRTAPGRSAGADDAVARRAAAIEGDHRAWARARAGGVCLYAPGWQRGQAARPGGLRHVQ